MWWCLSLAAALVLGGITPARAQSFSLMVSVSPDRAITLGEGLLLRWVTVPTAASCVVTVGTWSGEVPPIGQDWTVPSAEGPVTYQFTCRSGADNATPLTASVTVTVRPRPPLSSLELAWEDNADNEDGFRLERRSPGASYALLATLGVNVTRYLDGPLTGGTEYCYRVNAFNGAGASAWSNEACAVAP